ncbi:sensor histidine kinase [Aneurinibacillus uraniidurans]|uniref:sensor histidine kinase n=1 Tax=Aneurinibacillus uraniidurans TaxID=2966586 RepID=UPI00234B7DA4|nr:HAMP domain-containing sensor histidine kinase [Aneurinibacillus sp. B1]WCN36264.1 HAMP domain-containing sensor histidine kinase [Aneurinibacillus sp. B1]
MFKKTKRRLVMLNALVFFILQNTFGVIIYVYTHYSLYHQVDQTIIEKKNHLLQEKGKIKDELSPEREENYRLVYLLWENNSKLYQVLPQDSLSKINPARFSQLLNTTGLQTTSIEEGSYRVLTMSVAEKKIYSPVKNIQIVYNLKRENEMLNRLLMVIGFGSFLSVFIALIAGIYLANKALIPIGVSWEKQQRFVADASHELRTPLSVVKLNLEHLFRHPDASIIQESETIHQVIREIDYMSKMTNDLLTLARSDSNQLQIIEKPVQVDEILNQVVKDFEVLAILKNIQITADISPIRMIGDRERLKQLFVILLDNAIKYTKENGSISVKSSVKNSRAIIHIIDNGIGIPRKDLPYIFDRYYRSDKSRTRHSEGSGLGLSIANWIIHAHSGKIHVTSTERKGTHVSVSLPITYKN